MLLFEKLIMHPKRYSLKIYKTPCISWTWVSNHRCHHPSVLVPNSAISHWIK